MSLPEFEGLGSEHILAVEAVDIIELLGDFVVLDVDRREVSSIK